MITASTLISTEPANTVTGVPINEKITVMFSELMDPLTITTATFTLHHGIKVITGAVTYSGVTAMFSPASDLQPDTLYTATITTAAKDLAGNALAVNYRWNFITEADSETDHAILYSTAPKSTRQPVAVRGSKVSIYATENQSNPSLRRPDPGTPRGRIFEVASLMFAEYGFKNTSTRAIAEAAGVKQVMINYYWGTKVQLYESVLKFEGMTMLAVIFGANSDHKSPEEMLIDTPIRLMQVLHDNPQWASLLRREIADGAKHLRNALCDVSEHGPLGANLHFHNAYQDAVRTGKAVNLPIEAVRECLLAIGYGAMYLAPLISMINERDFHNETVWEEWKLTLSTILKRGLLINDPHAFGN
jgi:AcrR family transcriptional regulator